MKRLDWFERKFTFGLPVGMLPFYLEWLEGTIFRMEIKLHNVSDEILSAKPDGKWSVKQNIGHLAEVDEVANKRIDEIRTGTEKLSPAVFEPKDYNPWPIADVLEYFKRTRRDNLLKIQNAFRIRFSQNISAPAPECTYDTGRFGLVRCRT